MIQTQIILNEIGDNSICYVSGIFSDNVAVWKS